ncbi:ferritin-like domain-containing protein [Alcanivorax quisquiliarum]|uniref:Ferritin-like domain-containing protein n=1 Tax=Alcanivorax quisquiliarum TaxID=2933565 RepID=A0ABT0E9H3_9GAMM|nr:ferritin-like domain-containing protein [Alcanivorax quisquiliarum]MCK0538410.1 ferritin-like domain-containing protein [Alcanivorax quisquiliarum]
MTETAKHLDQWLRDAHAMEVQAEHMLTAQAKRLDDYPELKARVEQHLTETQAQRNQLEGCMKRRGVDASVVKDTAGRFSAMMQAMGNMLSGDEVVKGLLASYTFEHMEIASYRILVAAAEEEQDLETANICERICEEEEAMASWLETHMARFTQEFLARDEAAHRAAKR